MREYSLDIMHLAHPQFLTDESFMCQISIDTNNSHKTKISRIETPSPSFSLKEISRGQKMFQDS